ncbi:hypothetical protein SAMN04488577_3992 [Bacillus sp. cl95]|nr:hypothetical protein SAMN02799634_10912 [Bacillus sp. UNCCL13]SFQ91011.1 hypothetical protein SAMN04488577_3992 [Bacillus sp. cl95]
MGKNITVSFQEDCQIGNVSYITYFIYYAIVRQYLSDNLFNKFIDNSVYLWLVCLFPLKFPSSMLPKHKKNVSLKAETFFLHY